MKQDSIMIGDRFGELSVVDALDSGREGHRWLLRCDCGRWAVRSTARLRYVTKGGGKPCCSECHGELFRGLRIAQRNDRRDSLRALWNATGTLYGEAWEQAETERIRADLEKQGWPRIEGEGPGSEELGRGHSALLDAWSTPAVSDRRSDAKPDPVVKVETTASADSLRAVRNVRNLIEDEERSERAASVGLGICPKCGGTKRC